jgi:negative regulator of sigma-B (phosphoserine phosphatase)
VETLDPLPGLELGVATLALGGQTVSGDQHLVKSLAQGILVVVIDGLGHGQEAAHAAKIAVNTLNAAADHASLSIIALIQRCHEALSQTRGVVMSLALFNELDYTMTWAGVGNVAGVLLRADSATNPPQENILLRGGVVGYQLPILTAAVIPVMPGDLLIFATDGLDSSFAHGIPVNEPPQRLATRILAQHGKGTDDALVLVARWRKKEGDVKKKDESMKAEG